MNNRKQQFRKGPNGLALGGKATSKVGLFGATPIVQPSGATQEAVTLTAATVSTANGSDAGTTQTLANALKAELNKVIADNVALATLVNKLRTDLVALGAIKGAA